MREETMALIGLAVLIAVIGIAIAKTGKESTGFPRSRRSK